MQIFPTGGADSVTEGTGSTGKAGPAGVILEGVVIAWEAGALLGAGVEGPGGVTGVAKGD